MQVPPQLLPLPPFVFSEAENVDRQKQSVNWPQRWAFNLEVIGKDRLCSERMLVSSDWVLWWILERSVLRAWLGSLGATDCMPVLRIVHSTCIPSLALASLWLLGDLSSLVKSCFFSSSNILMTSRLEYYRDVRVVSHLTCSPPQYKGLLSSEYQTLYFSFHSEQGDGFVLNLASLSPWS